MRERFSGIGHGLKDSFQYFQIYGKFILKESITPFLYFSSIASFAWGAADNFHYLPSERRTEIDRIAPKLGLPRYPSLEQLTAFLPQIKARDQIRTDYLSYLEKQDSDRVGRDTWLMATGAVGLVGLLGYRGWRWFDRDPQPDQLSSVKEAQRETSPPAASKHETTKQLPTPLDDLGITGFEKPKPLAPNVERFLREQEEPPTLNTP